MNADEDDRPGTIQPDAGRGAALALAVAGLITVLGSVMKWSQCASTPCDGNLMAISEVSGISVGYGTVTAIAGILLAAIGIDASRHDGDSRYRSAASLIALLVLLTIGAFLTRTYVFRDESQHISGLPQLGAVLSGSGGLVALIASLRSRRRTIRSGSKAEPPT
jgi:hypothetical protein